MSLINKILIGHIDNKVKPILSSPHHTRNPQLIANIRRNEFIDSGLSEQLVEKIRDQAENGLHESLTAECEAYLKPQNDFDPVTEPVNKLVTIKRTESLSNAAFPLLIAKEPPEEVTQRSMKNTESSDGTTDNLMTEQDIFDSRWTEIDELLLNCHEIIKGMET